MSQYESEFEEKLYNERRATLDKIAALARKADPSLTEAAAKYPNSFGFTHTLTPQIEGVPALLPLGLDANGNPKSAEVLETEYIEAAVAGRIMAIRVQGKAGFATLQQAGQRLQIYVRKDDVGEDLFELYKLLDLGDHIGVRGTLMRTRTGELTLKVQNLTFLTKAMLALPDKWSGLEDVETRYRQRYVDLIVNSGHSPKTTTDGPPTAQNEVLKGTGFSPSISANKEEGALAPEVASARNVRETFVKRAAILRAIRKFFDARGYLEVETPMLHTIAGGATARTFTTHHNAEDMKLTLRIAPELHLKRLVVGGLDRVYEINRNFRNEGIDRTHNPEFTMLEFYQAYANYHDLMDLTEELIQFVAMEVNGTTKTTFNDAEIDLSKWTKLSMREAIIRDWPPVSEPPTESDLSSHDSLMTWLGRWQTRPSATPMQMKNPGYAPAQYLHEVEDCLRASLQALKSGGLYGKEVSNIFEAVCEPYLVEPTIIYDFPLAVSPLSKVKPDEPDWVERFEFYIGGFEVGNAFSELNDPDDQRARFLAQVADKDPESMSEVDEDYVRALGIGLPPTAGEGIGIDRLTMVLTGSRTIRDVMLFPLMRPQKRAEPDSDASGDNSAE